MDNEKFFNASYFKQLIGRRILDLYNSPDNIAYLLLEGGFKLELNEFNYVDIIDSSDTNKFVPLEIQRILYNPIYTFGILFEPFSIFEECFDIYLYIMALLPIDLNDIEKLQKSYELFLEYIEKMVCQKVATADAIISKDTYFQALRLHILTAKEILKGADEPNMSKNFILNTQNRLLYYNDLIQIISKIYTKEYNKLNEYITWNDSIAKSLIERTNSEGIQEKGKALEDLAFYFLSCIQGITITSRNQKTSTEEMDLCVCTYTTNPILSKIGSFAIVECKNHFKNLSSQMLRNLSQIMDSKGAFTSVLFTRSNPTKAAMEEIDKFKRVGKYFVVITIDEITNMRSNPCDLLKQKINETFTLNNTFDFLF